MLSVELSPRMHDGCPENCEDRLGWMPDVMSFYILSYLDPGITDCVSDITDLLLIYLFFHASHTCCCAAVAIANLCLRLSLTHVTNLVSYMYDVSCNFVEQLYFTEYTGICV